MAVDPLEQRLLWICPLRVLIVGHERVFHELDRRTSVYRHALAIAPADAEVIINPSYGRSLFAARVEPFVTGRAPSLSRALHENLAMVPAA